MLFPHFTLCKNFFDFQDKMKCVNHYEIYSTRILGPFILIRTHTRRAALWEAAKNISRGGSPNLAAFGRQVLTPP